MTTWRLGDLMMTVPARRSAIARYVDIMSQRAGVSRQVVLADLTGAMEHARLNVDRVLYFPDVRIVTSALAPMWSGKGPVQHALAEADQQITEWLRENTAKKQASR